MLKVCSGVTNEKEKDGVYKRSGRKGRERQELRYELSAQRALEVRTWRFYGFGLVNLVDLMNLKGLSMNQLDQPGLLGESASPFIDEGDGLTSERERVRMLLALLPMPTGTG